MKRIIVGISGASGAVIGKKVLEILRDDAGVQSHLIMSKAARLTIKYELDGGFEELADIVHDVNNLAASPASGSFQADGMIVAPCSIKTLSAIAYGQTGNLLVRSADVMLKERRPLVLMVRESPLHAGHIKAMLAATEAGAIIAPPMPAFYAKPSSIDEMAEHMAARALSLLGVESDKTPRWEGA